MGKWGKLFGALGFTEVRTPIKFTLFVLTFQQQKIKDWQKINFGSRFDKKTTYFIFKHFLDSVKN